MKLYKLYLREANEASVAAPGTPGAAPVEQDKLSMSQDEAQKKIDTITAGIKRSVEALVLDLNKLPVMATNAEAKTRLEYLMGNLTKFKETFDEGGSNYQSIMAAMQAGGKATTAGINK